MCKNNNLPTVQGEEIAMDKSTKLTRDILALLASNNCTVAEAEDILCSVSNVIRNTAPVQLNDKAEKIFKASADWMKDRQP